MSVPSWFLSISARLLDSDVGRCFGTSPGTRIVRFRLCCLRTWLVGGESGGPARLILLVIGSFLVSANETS